ncbi:MAG: DoxX family membrane protein, partial [Calditrichales bacterium]
MPSQSNSIRNENLSPLQRNFLLILRLIIGWHLLYEGVAKLLIPSWTAAPYLATARGFMSGIFNWIASHPDLLRLVDLLNIWGLILIGVGLILGIFLRSAAISGIVLLGLYYIAHPPFVGLDFGIPQEGHYLIVNKTLVEMIALAVIAVFPAGYVFRLD